MMELRGGSFSADVSNERIDGAPIIRGYGDDYFQVEGERFLAPLMLHQGKVTSPWGPEKPSELTLDDLQTMMAEPPEILILGMGMRIQFPSEEILAALRKYHIGVEYMDSRAAARTYNIIVGEGRTVSACLFLPSA